MNSQVLEHYALWFTDKDVSKLETLNFYELQHALYAAWKDHDAQERDPAGTGLAKVKAVHDEYERRGLSNSIRPNL